MLAVQRAKHLEKDRHDVSADDIRVYFESISAQPTSIPSAFFWNVDGTRVGSAKHMPLPDVIVASETKAGSVTIPEIRDDAQLTLLTAISAFRDSTYSYFISKNKTFEKTALEAQQLFEGHDYTIKTSPRTFIV
jgi:CYTH domain-containing protein